MLKQSMGVIAVFALFTSLWLAAQPISGKPGVQVSRYLLRVVQ